MGIVGALRRSLLFGVVSLLVAAGCAPKNVPGLKNPEELDAFCSGHYVARITAIENIATSLSDGAPKPSARTFAQMVAQAKARTGIVATWDGAPLFMPKDARAFGESDDYLRIKRVVIANVPEGADPPRPIDLEVRDHGTYRWYTF